MDGTEAADRFLDNFITTLCCAIAADGLSTCTPYVLNDGIYERLLVDYFLANEQTLRAGLISHLVFFVVNDNVCSIRRKMQCEEPAEPLAYSCYDNRLIIKAQRHIVSRDSGAIPGRGSGCPLRHIISFNVALIGMPALGPSAS